MRSRKGLIIFYIALCLYWPLLQADNLDTVLQQEEAPEGVVFEIVSSDPNLLVKLLPSLQLDIQRLRAKFIDLPVAIVTHGKEQFALRKQSPGNAHSQAHSLVRELIQQDGVDVHVCGTYAENKGYEKEDFVDFIDVAAEGPAQINDYKKLGYTVIKLP